MDIANVSQGALGLAGLVAVVFACIAGYLLPAIIAERRRHRNKGAIAVLNVLLGWTFLGWVVALIWSSTANTDYQNR